MDTDYTGCKLGLKHTHNKKATIGGSTPKPLQTALLAGSNTIGLG